MWELGIKSRSSVRTASGPNHLAIPPALHLFFETESLTEPGFSLSATLAAGKAVVPSLADLSLQLQTCSSIGSLCKWAGYQNPSSCRANSVLTVYLHKQYLFVSQLNFTQPSPVLNLLYRYR